LKDSPNIAVIGCGYWGKNLVRNFHALGALSAVCENDAVLGQAMAEEHNVPLRPVADVLADPDVPAVVIAAPAEQHTNLVTVALRAGKHVFVEKPLSLTAHEGAKLCDLAAEKKRTLMVGHLLQYHPAFLKLMALCRDGVLGRLNYIASNRLNFGKIRTNENALWSFAPHDISMILALFNDEPESVNAMGHCFLNKAVADVTTTHLTFASGQAAHIHVSWLHPVKEQRLFVIGEKGMAFFDDGEDWPSKISLFDHQIDWRDGIPIPTKADGKPVPVDPAEPLRLECQHFLDCVVSGETPRTDGIEALRVLRVLDAAQRSINEQRPILLKTGASAPTDFIHPTACIDTPSEIGDGTKIWHFSHVLKNSTIGKNCNIGQNVVIGPNVAIGDGCKIQNNVSVYDGVTLEDNVFCGPSMVFTNVTNPRAEVSRKNEFNRTLVRTGVTIGANATIVCGSEIGRYAFIGAGAVVTKDVPDHALMIGNPARRIGDMCVCGERLPDGDWAEASCPECDREFVRTAGHVKLAKPND
jgi:UDP-2-acetamido-3-amino-2,3-dideoxy-glucuronate N-acetyltransferase